MRRLLYQLLPPNTLQKAIVSFLLLCLGLLIKVPFAIAGSTIQLLDQKQFQQHIAELQTTIQAPSITLNMQAPEKKAHLLVTPMFSNQYGSWPFESFAKNNLFRVIATYQTHHPKMVVIKEGSITLTELNTMINNPAIMRPFRDGYLLSYPLLILEDAALLVENTSLYLNNRSGTAIINKGLFSLIKAKLESRADKVIDNTVNKINYRPFIINWSGSRLQIIDSQLTKLGYDGYLARGITSALNNNQPINTPPTQIQIINSQFNHLFELNLKHAIISINQSKIDGLQRYGIDITDSQFEITNSRIQNIKNNSGIRIQQKSSGILEKNVFLATKKASIELNQVNGNIIIRDNIVAKESRNGVLLKDIESNNTNLLIQNNFFSKLSGTAIEATNFAGTAYIINNTIYNSAKYATDFKNNIQYPTTNMIFYGNNISEIGRPILRVSGITNILLGHNKILGSGFYQNILMGDLLPLQGILLEATIKYPCIVQITTTNNTKQSTNQLDYSSCRNNP